LRAVNLSARPPALQQVWQQAPWLEVQWVRWSVGLLALQPRLRAARSEGARLSMLGGTPFTIGKVDRL